VGTAQKSTSLRVSVASFAAGRGKARFPSRSALRLQLIAIACKSGVLNPMARILLTWREPRSSQ
jgi:hypothetical protein